MPRQTHRALFSPNDAPPGGVCLSSFVVASSPRGILVGKMAKPEVWADRFFVGEKFASNYAASGKFLLPARHLAWYESPLGAALGVVKDQLGWDLRRPKLKLLDVQSHIRWDEKNEDTKHWDLCFVYGLKVTTAEAKRLKQVPWFRDLGFRPASGLRQEDFTRGHGDILLEARIIERR